MSRIALVMIARDEARCIARCLRSARPWVDEMIVLDTGSCDATIDIARAEGARVHTFQWVDHFAAARNAALSLSDADWNVVLDADEWIEAGGDVLSGLRTQSPGFVGAIEINSHFDQGAGQSIAPSWLPRVLPGGVRYEGRVHEYPTHHLPTQRLMIRVGHDGYLRSQMDAKGNRNLILLEEALSERPDDPYLLYQLGKDHEVHDRFEAACGPYRSALALCPSDRSYRHDLVIRAMFTLKEAGHIEEAIELAQAEMPSWQTSADFFFTLGDVLLSHAMRETPQAAQDLLPMIESCWLRCLELGDTPALEGAVRGRGSHLAAHNLVVFYDSLGETVKADAWRALANRG